MRETEIVLMPQFLEGGEGHIFMQVMAPSGSSVRGVVVMMPPLFEELNKSRRMHSLQARRLASHGIVSVLPDFHGIGDSEGSLHTASDQIWKADLANVLRWIADSFGGQSVNVFAMRSAAIFCGMLVEAGFSMSSLTLWSPIEQGSKLVRDLFRQAMIAARNQGNPTINSKELKAQMLQDGSIEISGYLLTAGLIRQIENLSLPKSLPPRVDSAWFDVRSTVDPVAPVREPLRVSCWRESGNRVDYSVIQGPPFWHTSEISVVPELIDRTTSVLRERMVA